MTRATKIETGELVRVPAGSIGMEGTLAVPEYATGLVLFAHGSGSSRHSPRNNFVAAELRKAGLGTFLFDLLTLQEDLDYERRFDIDLLTQRLLAATEWIRNEPRTRRLTLGYFGASTGAAAALAAAAELGSEVGAVVSRGGRPDLVETVLHRVTAPTLLIVGGNDDLVLELNWRAHEKLRTTKELAIVPGATHLFEEPGALEEVARRAAEWLAKYLSRPSSHHTS